MRLGIIFTALVCDVYHREDGIVKNAQCARIAAQESLAVLTQIETASRNGSTSIRRARKIPEYTSPRSVYRVRSRYTSRDTLLTYIHAKTYIFFRTTLGFSCLISIAHTVTLLQHPFFLLHIISQSVR